MANDEVGKTIELSQEAVNFLASTLHGGGAAEPAHTNGRSDKVGEALRAGMKPFSADRFSDLHK